MNRPEAHPDSELLDKLRAGLLDDTAQKDDVQAHLAHCADCRRRYDWPALLQPDNRTLDLKLEALRRQAFEASSTRHRSRRLVPLAVAAALGLLAIALVNLVPGPDNGQPQMATNSSEVPELYEDLDFYLWMAEHHAIPDSST